LFDRLGKPKLPAQAPMLLLKYLGATPVSVTRSWEDTDEVVTGAFVSSFAATGTTTSTSSGSSAISSSSGSGGSGGSSGSSGGSSGATTTAVTLAVVNAGTTTQHREILLVGDFTADVLQTLTGEGYNCQYDAVVASQLTLPGELRIIVAVPPSCAVVLKAETHK
jgi:hypothetical protein